MLLNMMKKRLGEQLWNSRNWLLMMRENLLVLFVVLLGTQLNKLFFNMITIAYMKERLNGLYLFLKESLFDKWDTG